MDSQSHEEWALHPDEFEVPWGDAYCRCDATVEQKQTALQEFNSFWDRLEQEASDPSDAAFSNKAKANRENVSYAERYEKLVRVMNNKPSHRELLYRILRDCAEPQELSVLENAIQAYPEYRNAAQNPYRLIMYLVDGGGLDLIEVGFDGSPITDEQKEGLTEDEVDDLIDVYQVCSTDIGKAIADDMAPARRLEKLFELFDDRLTVSTDLMRFCSEPRTYKDIERFFAGKDLSTLKTLHPEAGISIKPSVLVDGLEKAGALVWENGWSITEEGQKYLQGIVGERSV